LVFTPKSCKINESRRLTFHELVGWKFTYSYQEEVMIKNRNAFVLVAAILLIFSLACSLSATPKKETSPAASSNSAVQPQNQSEAQPQIQPQSKPVITAVPLPVTPVGLNEGLSSLNSYTFSIQVISNGPTSQDKSDTHITNSHDSNGDNSKIHTETISSTAKDPKEDKSSTTNYRVGNKSCTVDENGESDTTTDDNTPAQKEMASIGMNLTDITINVENPVRSGVETVSGINCNHFTFTVKGLGKNSGAEVTQSSGEYWSAVDGNYLVKYDVVLETRNAPENSAGAEVLHYEMHFLLSDINAPITIQMPAQCS
jgi:hypothetical protein